jgi:hypothetical protein
MGFMSKLDLNFVCRVFEWLAIATFVIGVFASVVLSIQSSYFGGTTFLWGTLLVGFVYSFIAAISILFLSRIGDALDDIRNKICYPEEETIREETE